MYNVLTYQVLNTLGNLVSFYFVANDHVFIVENHAHTISFAQFIHLFDDLKTHPVINIKEYETEAG